MKYISKSCVVTLMEVDSKVFLAKVFEGSSIPLTRQHRVGLIEASVSIALV